MLFLVLLYFCSEHAHFKLSVNQVHFLYKNHTLVIMAVYRVVSECVIALGHSPTKDGRLRLL